MEPTTASSSEATPGSAPAAVRRCGNCGAELLGEHCHACGQPTKGLVRHFGSIVGDFLDSVFDLDSRTWRTLGPLLLRPGHLTLEYFAGRRVRYVSPVRLFFFMVVLAFLALRLATADSEGFDVQLGQTGVQLEFEGEFGRIDTIEGVEARRDELLAEIGREREANAGIPGVAFGMDAAMAAVRAQAEARIAEIEREANAADEASADEGAPATPAPPGDTPAGAPGTAPAGTTETADASVDDDLDFRFNGRPWHPVDNPLVVGWLPGWANARLNHWVGRVQANARRIGDEPGALREAFLENLPIALFAMLPLFALLLKLVYLFKRRLYMEHLIVALHSHAFLSFGLLLVALAMLGRAALGEGALATGLGWFEAAMFAWMPLYLLVMQKRVYRQGWIMTVIRFGVLGTAYSVLLSFGTLLALAISLVTM